MQYLKSFEMVTTEYLLGRPTYAWLKKIMKNISNGYWIKDERLKTLSDRRKELRLSEYQNLFDYYNFCKNNDFDLSNNHINRYISLVEDWIWYLTACQMIPEELKNAGKDAGKVRDLYTTRYEQILSLPKLTGNLEEDKVIFEDVLRNQMYESYSPVRNGLILYDIYFRNKRHF